MQFCGKVKIYGLARNRNYQVRSVILFLLAMIMLAFQGEGKGFCCVGHDFYCIWWLLKKPFVRQTKIVCQLLNHQQQSAAVSWR